jgi:hypothetical protein
VARFHVIPATSKQSQSVNHFNDSGKKCQANRRSADRRLDASGDDSSIHSGLATFDECLREGRHKMFRVQDDDHLRGALRYVERNALRAELVARAQDWKWSSLAGSAVTRCSGGARWWSGTKGSLSGSMSRCRSAACKGPCCRWSGASLLARSHGLRRRPDDRGWNRPPRSRGRP